MYMYVYIVTSAHNINLINSEKVRVWKSLIQNYFFPNRNNGNHQLT